MLSAKVDIISLTIYSTQLIFLEKYHSFFRQANPIQKALKISGIIYLLGWIWILNRKLHVTGYFVSFDPYHENLNLSDQDKSEYCTGRLHSFLTAFSS